MNGPVVAFPLYKKVTAESDENEILISQLILFGFVLSGVKASLLIQGPMISFMRMVCSACIRTSKLLPPLVE